MFTYTHTYMYTHIYIHTCTYTHTYIHIHTSTYIHTHIHTYIHTYTHTHTHIHTYIPIYDTAFVLLRAVSTVTGVRPCRPKIPFDSRHRIQPDCGVYLASAISLCSGEHRDCTGRKYLPLQNSNESKQDRQFTYSLV